MKRYSFRLEKVLRVRRTQEELARAVLLSAHQTAREAEHYLADVIRRHESRDQHGVRPTAMFLGDRFRHDRSAEVVVAARRARDDAQFQVMQARAVWESAAQRVSALERLDERRRGEWALDFEREQTREVDDLVVGRFRFKRQAAAKGREACRA